jgi:hypothetical protein
MCLLTRVLAMDLQVTVHLISYVTPIRKKIMVKYFNANVLHRSTEWN